MASEIPLSNLPSVTYIAAQTWPCGLETRNTKRPEMTTSTAPDAGPFMSGHCTLGGVDTLFNGGLLHCQGGPSPRQFLAHLPTASGTTQGLPFPRKPLSSAGNVRERVAAEHRTCAAGQRTGWTATVLPMICLKAHVVVYWQKGALPAAHHCAFALCWALAPCSPPLH